MLIPVSITVLERYARLLAIQAWNNIKSRAYGRNQASYAKVEVRMTREEFDTWALREYVKWFQDHPEEIPSVDRIDSNGHYEISNIRLMEVWENRTSNKRNKHLRAPAGTLWCPGCKSYLAQENFYERPSVPLTATNIRNHWSAECKECSRKTRMESWYAKYGKKPAPSGICQRCNRTLPLTPQGKISAAKYCGSCRHVLWAFKDRETPPEVSQKIREAMAKKKEETGSIFG